MRKLVVSVWVSLDGVFDANSMGQWFAPFDSLERQEHIRQEILESDALLLGRVTYEMLAPYWSSLKNNEMGIAAKLNSMPKFVVSSTLEKADWNNSSIINDNVIEEVARLKQQPGGDIQIDGSGILVKSLIKAGLIDEYRILVHPAIMGIGKRFFQEGLELTNLELVESKTLAAGVVLLRYRPAQKK